MRRMNPPARSYSPSRLLLAALALAFSSTSALAQNVGSFVLTKIQNFEQTSSAAPVMDATAPFQFGSFVTPGAAMLNGATLTFNGTANPRSYDGPPGGVLFILETFATLAQLNAAYPSSSYTLTAETSAGMFSKSITIFPFTYPVTPRLTVPAGDWQDGVLVIDPAVDYTLTWAPFSNAQAPDLIQLTIPGSGLALTPFPATETSYTIPAGTLQPGRTYTSDLSFLRVAGATAADANFGAGFAFLTRNTGFTIRTPAAALAFIGAVAPKNHEGAGVFAINLVVPGGTAVESRTGGAAGAHTIVFAFNNEIASATPTVTGGTASISGPPVILANTVTVNLTGVADAQTVTVTLTDTTDVFGQTLANTAASVGFVLGDTTGDGFVNSADALQTRTRAGEMANATNFRSDVNLDGVVNSGDAFVVRGRSGAGITAAAR